MNKKQNLSSKHLQIDLSHTGLYVRVYIPLIHNKYRTKIVYGSRGSGKSFAACLAKVLKCLRMRKGKFKCLMCRKFKEDVRESLYAEVKGVIEFLKLEHLFRFYEATCKIVCIKNGNSFIAKGLHESSSKQGKGNVKGVKNPTDVIVDEADEISLSEYVKLSGSLRGSNEIEEVLIFNTPPVDHWIIQRWFPDVSAFENADGSHTYIDSILPSTMILHTTYKHNPFLSSSAKQFYSLLKLSNPELYKQDGLGLLQSVKTGGEALPAFSKTKHVTDVDYFNPNIPILFCWDFNRRPHHTVSAWQFSYDDALAVFFADMVTEFVIPDASINETAKACNKWLRFKGYKLNVVRLIADNSGNKQLDAGADTFVKKILNQIARDGFKARDETNANPFVIPSLEFLNDILAGTITLNNQSNYPDKPINIRINAKCKFHIADFEKTRADKDGKLVKVEKTVTVNDAGLLKKVRVQVRGHGVDNSRYMVVGVFDTEYQESKTR